MGKTTIIFCDKCSVIQYLDNQHPYCRECENLLFSIDVPAEEEIDEFKVREKLKQQRD